MINTLSFSIKELTVYINWLYFFYAWQIPAKAVKIIVEGKEAPNNWNEKTLAQWQEGKKLFKDAQQVLQEFQAQGYQVKCRVGLFDAQTEDDNIIIYNDSNKKKIIPCLRQQHAVEKDKPNLCLSDYIMPRAMGKKDRIGAFATTIPTAMEESYSQDAYKHLIAQTLSDRLAEAATEKAHLKVRKEIWGYAPHENLNIEELLSEKWQGIRPAIGYPSLPDQSVNFLLDELIDMKELGITLTENGAMKPHASVSGFMFSHPKATYFSVGKINNEQLRDYALRRNLPVDKLKQFLSANLNTL